MKKNGDANNNPTLIIFVAVIFILGGLFGTLSIILSQVSIWLLVTILLLAVGILFMVYGIKRAKVLKQIKTLEQNAHAYITDATFIKAKLAGYKSTSVSSGMFSAPTSLNVYKKIIYSYVDQNGLSHTVKSALSYFPNQVKYLQEKGTFKIKCDGEVSIITEELPNGDSMFNI